MKDLLEFSPKVSKNYAEDFLTKIVNLFSSDGNADFMSKLYDILLGENYASKLDGERLWLKISISRLNVLRDCGRYEEAYPLIQNLKGKLDTLPETTRNLYNSEVIAAEMEYYLRQNELDIGILDELYKKGSRIIAAVAHPRIIGVIRECGGKVSFHKGDYEKARVEFYECFKSLDEIGSPLKNRVLKYLGLCSILSESSMNPFESQETQSYSQLSEFTNILSLIENYEQLNLKGFIETVSEIAAHESSLFNDKIFRCSLNKILYLLKSKKFIGMLRSYKTLTFRHVSKILDMHNAELIDMVLKLTTIGKVANLSIDFVNEYIEIDHDRSLGFALSNFLSSREVVTNLNCLDILFGKKSESNDENSSHTDSSEGYMPDSSTNTREPIHSKFLLYNDRPNLEEEWLPAAQLWCDSICSALPPFLEDEISQKDQVMFEQKAESEYSRTFLRSSRTDGPFSTLLTATNSKKDLERFFALKKWYQELVKYQTKLSSSYN